MSTTKTFQKDEQIIQKGQPASVAYMVLSGAVRVYLENEGKTVTLAQLEIGSIFGESALFGGEEYGAHISATEETELLPITPESFQEKLDGCDPMIKQIISMLIERQRNTNSTLLKRETQELMDLVLI